MTAEATPESLHVQPDGSKWPVPPKHGYTVEDLYRLDLPEHTELIDGSLVFVSPQRMFHTLAMYLLENGLRRTVPEQLRVCREMAVVLSPGTVPEPDLLVVKAEAVTSRRQTRFEVKDVVLAVEVVSPDSEERDRDTKPHKYAAAGIPHFWRVEMTSEDRPMVCVFQLDLTTKTYVPTGIHHDQLKVPVPYTVDIDLTEFDRM